MHLSAWILTLAVITTTVYGSSDSETLEGIGKEFQSIPVETLEYVQAFTTNLLNNREKDSKDMLEAMLEEGGEEMSVKGVGSGDEYDYDAERCEAACAICEKGCTEEYAECEIEDEDDVKEHMCSMCNDDCSSKSIMSFGGDSSRCRSSLCDGCYNKGCSGCSHCKQRERYDRYRSRPWGKTSSRDRDRRPWGSTSSRDRRPYDSTSSRDRRPWGSTSSRDRRPWGSTSSRDRRPWERKSDRRSRNRYF